MSLIKKNIAANLAGNIWQSLLSLAFIPLYIKFLGAESYGLIGIFAAFQAMFGLLDMGISSTLNRELARLAPLKGSEQEMRNTVRSLEIIYWTVALLIGVSIIAMSPIIANHWVKANRLSPQTIEQAFRIMGIAMALQWPASFYAGGLMGLQKQILANAAGIIINTFRSGGVVLILWLFSPTVQAFFLWQLVSSAINTGFLAFFLWHYLPHTGNKAVFEKQIVKNVWKFATGITGISLLARIPRLLDKFILSKLISLEMFGYYTLAGTIAMSLYRFIIPVNSAIFPKITQLVSLNDQEGVKELYHKSCQFMSVLILPITVIIAMFSYELLLLWTKNPVTAEKTYLLASVLICGTALNGLVNIPYKLYQAHGRTKLILVVNSIAIILLTPLIVHMVRRYGALGCAVTWVILNAVYSLFFIHFMHKQILPSEKRSWYWQDVGYPLAASLLIAGMGRLFIGPQTSHLTLLLYIAAISILTLIGATFATSTTRNWISHKLSCLNQHKLIYAKDGHYDADQKDVV